MANPTPSKATVVGHMFLTHFYKILSLSPEKLFSLYVNDAVFSFGDETGVISSHAGVNSIKDAIEKLDFQGCSAVISSADYQATYNGAVLILTVGTFYRPSKDRSDASVRRFVQNFLLVPQGKSAFCIMSHSMVFLKESDQSNTVVDATPTSNTGSTSTSTPVESSTTPPPPTAAPATTTAVSTPVPAAVATVTAATTTATATNAVVAEPTSSTPAAPAPATEQTPTPAKHSKSHTSKGAKSSTASASHTATTAATQPTTAPATTAAPVTTTSSATAAPTKSATEKPAKKSWATIVSTEGPPPVAPATTATGSTTTATAATTAPTAAATAPTAPAATTTATATATTTTTTTATAPTATTGTTPAGNQTGQPKRPWQKTRPLPDGSTGPSRDAYISNLPYTASEEQVRARFASYGTIKKLHLQKGTAQIEFESPESVANAIKDAKQKIVELDGRQIHVDDRKRGPKGKFVHKDQRGPAAVATATTTSASGGARSGTTGTAEKRSFRPRPAAGANGN